MDRLLENSLSVAGLATLLALGMGFVVAVGLTGVPARFRPVFLVFPVVALALPPFVVTNCWLDLLGPAGVWRRWLPANVMSLGGAAWLLALLLWPVPVFALAAAWRRLEPAQLESDMAVSGWPMLRALLLPLGRAALVVAALLVFVLALNNFTVPAILQVKVFPAEVWIRFNTTFDTLGAVRLSWPLVAGPLVLLLALTRRQSPWPHLQPAVPAGLFRQQLGPLWFWSCSVGAVLVCALSVVLPLFQILSVKRTWTELPGAIAAGQAAAWHSVGYAVLAASAILALSLGGGTAPGQERCESPARAPAELRPRASASIAPRRFVGRFNRFAGSGSRLAYFLWLPFLAPGVLLGICLITLFNHAWSGRFYQSAGIVILAFGVRYFALGWMAARHAVRGSDPDLTDAARLDGAGWWRSLRHVYWPQIRSHIMAAWYIIFVLCLWDVESLLLIVPPGGETLALRIFNLLHYGHNAQVNALCLVLLGLALAPLLAWLGARAACCMWRAAGLRLARRALRALFALASVSLLLAGCGPPSSTAALVKSRLFSSVQIIGSRGTGVGQLNKPRSVAVDRQDNLYVVDMTGRVQKFSPSGDFLLSWQMPQTDLGKPKGMGRDSDGNIIVVEPHYQRVNHFSVNGKLLAQWGQRGTNDGQLSMPRSVAVNSRREVFVSEYGLVERVQKFKVETNATPAVRWLASFGKPGTGPGEFNRAEGLCVDAQDRVYVADSCNHRIQVFSSDGKFLRSYGFAGSGKGEFSYPYDIAVDRAGRQYVCEFGNSRIQVFDAHDQPLEIIGAAGGAPGEFSNPWGLAFDSHENLYVADSQNHRVQKFIRR